MVGAVSGVLMKCGCVAMTVCSKKDGVVYDPTVPSCLTHDCLDIEAAPPDLSGRRTRCDYFGRGGFRNYECNYRARTGCSRQQCMCELPSDLALPFFIYKPAAKWDRFYCGCAGWD